MPVLGVESSTALATTLAVVGSLRASVGESRATSRFARATVLARWLGHQAKGEIEAAVANKGGHRAKALGLIQQAIDAVNAGMQYAAAHPTEVGPLEGPAAPEPVDEVVPEAGRQPHMARGIIALREAHRQLVEPKHDKGGFRVQALGFIQQAMVQVREGIRFANTH